MMGRKIQDGFLSCLHFSWSAGIAEHIKRVAGQAAILPLLIQNFASCILPSNILRIRYSDDPSMWAEYAHAPKEKKKQE